MLDSNREAVDKFPLLSGCAAQESRMGSACQAAAELPHYILNEVHLLLFVPHA